MTARITIDLDEKDGLQKFTIATLSAEDNKKFYAAGGVNQAPTVAIAISRSCEIVGTSKKVPSEWHDKLGERLGFVWVASIRNRTVRAVVMAATRQRDSD